MKKALKILMKGLLFTIGGLLGLILLMILFVGVKEKIAANRTLKKCEPLQTGEVQTLSADGFRYRGLNKNGRLDIYEDSRMTAEDRTEDLLSQMTLEEKAGCMFFSPIGVGKDGSLPEGFSLRNFMAPLGTSESVFLKKMNHFNIFLATDAEHMAQWYNNLQRLAERTRLGIPVTIASDPRNHGASDPLSAAMSGGMTLFPTPLGLSAMHDSAEMAAFADMVRQEYLALGIRVALHPQIDLATEPRWWRISGTFGEDAAWSATMTSAYIEGFQGDSIGPWSVACMTKHWPGGGPQEYGWDAHFEYGKDQVYPGNNFDYHLIPFEAAFEAGTAMLMPYYGVPVGQTGEDVGMSYNRDIIQGLLRGGYGYEGVVCTDWSLVHDNRVLGMKLLSARAWGMEDATEEERVEKIIGAGVDQFGGEACPEIIVALVQDGRISEERIDESLRRILKLKFEMGLFDDPFVDVGESARLVGNDHFKAAAEMMHRESFVLLKNDTIEGSPLLPLSQGLRIYVENMDEDLVAPYGTIVKKPEQADVALIRLHTPAYKMKGTGPLGAMIKGGDLDFKGKEKEKILALLSKVPAVVDISMDRPAVIPEIAAASRGLFASFGSPDEAFLDLVFGNFDPQGKLPFEIPSSMEAVENQLEDVPYDSKDPLFPFGYGISYTMPL